MKYLQLDLLDGIPALNSKSAHFCMDMHVHDEFVIAAYFSGQKSYSSLEQSGFMTKGDFLTISPRIPHSARSSSAEGCQYIAIYPTVRQIAEATDRDPIHVEQRMHGVRAVDSNNGGIKIGGELALLLEESAATVEFAAAIFFSDLLNRFDDLEGNQTVKPSSVREVWEKIYDDPLADIDLGDLAFLAGLSKEHLCRAFKTTYGISPFQLLRARRTTHARDLIRNGTSLAEAAIVTRFSDQSHMTRWFKRIYGASPRSVAAYQ